MDWLANGESVAVILGGVGGMLAFVWRSLTQKITRDIEEISKDIEAERHARKNLEQRQDALERSHNEQSKRNIRTETLLDGLQKTTERMERNVDELLKLLRDRP